MVFNLIDILPALPELLLAALALVLVLVAAFGGEGARILGGSPAFRLVVFCWHWHLSGLVRQMTKRPLEVCIGQTALLII